MGHETISTITGNIEEALSSRGLIVTRKALDEAGSIPAGMMPLAELSYNGESFEDSFGERPALSEARFTIKTIMPERDGPSAIDEEQRLAHEVRSAMTVEALNSNGLSSIRPVVTVSVPGFDVASNNGFSKISMDVNVRYREQ